MRDSIPSSPGDGGAATLAADSSTDSVTELIDLEASDTAETPFAAAASSPLLTTQKNSTSKDPSPSTPGQRTSPRKSATKKPESDDDCIMLSSDDEEDEGTTKPRKRKSEDAASLPSSSTASALASLASPITEASGKCVNCKQHLANVKHCPKLESSVRSEKEALGHPNIAIEGFASTEEKPQVT